MPVALGGAAVGALARRGADRGGQLRLDQLLEHLGEAEADSVGHLARMNSREQLGQVMIGEGHWRGLLRAFWQGTRRVSRRWPTHRWTLRSVSYTTSGSIAGGPWPCTRRTGIARPRRRRRFSPMSRAGPPGQRSMQPLPRSIQRAPGHVLNMWFPRGLRALRVEHEHGLFETPHVVSERFLSFGLEEAEAGAGGVGDAGDSPEAAVGGLGDDGTAEGTKSGDGGFDVIDLPEDRPLRRLFGGQ